MTVLTDNQVVVLSGDDSAPSERAARALAQYMGADAALISLADASDLVSLRQKLSACAALVASLEAVASLTAKFALTANDVAALLGSVPHTFIYGCSEDAAKCEILSELTAGGIAGCSLATTAECFEVAGDREHCRQFAGLKIPGYKAGRDGWFVEGASRVPQDVLIRVAGQPFLVRVQRAQSNIFLAACNEIADLDETAGWKEGLVPWFSRLAPLMIFLKSGLGDRLWHNGMPRACFVLDDPPLKSRYGFFEYAELLREMEGRKFAASIAFIPWNHRRSQNRVSAMFAGNEKLSLCVHGCDHTAGEFASTNSRLLRGKAKLALERMQQHALRSGVAFDEVMVFPQGLFSQPALTALDAAGYVAAVNTDLCAVDSNQWLTLRDLMEPAITTAEGFPLFARHYPRNLEQFAFDLFVGKPALVVEHHTYYRNGYEEMARFVDGLNALDDRLQWSRLADICSSTFLQRTSASGEVEVRFFTRYFRFENRDARSHRFVLSRKQPAGMPGPVTVGGQNYFSCEHDRDTLTISMTLDGCQKVQIETASVNSESHSSMYWRPAAAYALKVRARRWMCDLRDNYIETNSSLRALFASLRGITRKRRASAGSAVLTPTSRQDATA